MLNNFDMKDVPKLRQNIAKRHVKLKENVDQKTCLPPKLSFFEYRMGESSARTSAF